MKLKLLALLPLFSAYTLSAQLVITPGAQFSVAGNIQLTLQNTNLVNDGSFLAGNGRTSFTGNTASSISGSQPIQFFELEMNKTNSSSVLLQRAIGVTQRILFTSGFLNLNSFNTDLGSTAILDGEQENSRITGVNGGQVLFSASLNAPTSANPGNLGAIITSSQNLGNVIIKRGQQAQLNGTGLSNSILRFYDIVPANNTNLNATLRFNYFDGELNGFNENSLVLFKSDDAINWSLQGFNSRDSIADFVEKTGIGSFSRWTLSRIDNTLTVNFTLFNAICQGNNVLLSWKTAQEQNSDHFNIEKSRDGTNWTAISTLQAAGNSATERTYSFTDNSPALNAYYRIAEYDLDGNVQYTGIIRSSCNATDVINIWPNPAHDRIIINIVTANGSQALIKLFDSKGALVKTQNETVLPGSNQLSVDVNSLARGVYTLSVDWDNGQMKKAVQVLKQ